MTVLDLVLLSFWDETKILLYVYLVLNSLLCVLVSFMFISKAFYSLGKGSFRSIPASILKCFMTQRTGLVFMIALDLLYLFFRAAVLITRGILLYLLRYADL